MGEFRVDLSTFEQYKQRVMVLKDADDIKLSGNRELALLNLPVFQKLLQEMERTLGAEFIRVESLPHTLFR